MLQVKVEARVETRGSAQLLPCLAVRAREMFSLSELRL